MFDVDKLTDEQQAAIYALLGARKYSARVRSSASLALAIMAAAYWVGRDMLHGQGHGASLVVSLVGWLLIAGVVLSILSLGLALWIERKAKTMMRDAGIPDLWIDAFRRSEQVPMTEPNRDFSQGQ